MIELIPPQSLRIVDDYIQWNLCSPALNYSLTVSECTAEYNMNKIRWTENYATWMVARNPNYIDTRGIELIKKLGFDALRLRRHHFVSS